MRTGSDSGLGITVRYLIAAIGLVVVAGLVAWLAPTPSPAATPAPTEATHTTAHPAHPATPPEPPDTPADLADPSTPSTPPPATTTPPPPPPITAPPTIAVPVGVSVDASLDLDGLELFGEHPCDEVVYRLDVAVAEPPARVTISWDDRLGGLLLN